MLAGTSHTVWPQGRVGAFYHASSQAPDGSGLGEVNITPFFASLPSSCCNRSGLSGRELIPYRESNADPT